MWLKNKRPGNSSRRSCSGPIAIHLFGSENNVQPHVLNLSVPSALSPTNVTIPEPIHVKGCVKAENKKPVVSKTHFLRQPRKSVSQSRAMQKIKNWRESKSGSVSSNEELQEDSGKLKGCRWIFSDHRRLRGRSYSTSEMVAYPIRDLQMFGSVPPTPSLVSDKYRPNFPSTEFADSFRTKSATLPNNVPNNLTSVFERTTLEDSLTNNASEWFSKSAPLHANRSLNQCPCTSCRERRWPGPSGSNYQFPYRSQSDFIALEKLRRKTGFYYNSHPVELENETPEIVPNRKKQSKKYLKLKSPNAIVVPVSASIYANMDAIQNANERIMKSTSVSSDTSGESRYKRNDTEFHSLPKNFLKSLDPHLEACHTFPDIEPLPGIITNISCPCCGNAFYYKISNNYKAAKLGRCGQTISEPSTPVGFLRNGFSMDIPNPFISNERNLKTSLSLDGITSETAPDYLKPNNGENKKEDISMSLGHISNNCKSKDPMSEIHLMYMVPPPQCHSSKGILVSHTYENEEYWRERSQACSGSSQVNYVAYVHSEIGRSNSPESPKDSPTSDSQSENVDQTSFSTTGEQKCEQEEKEKSPTLEMDVAKYEIQKEPSLYKIPLSRSDQAVTCGTGPNIYLRPRPQDPSANFPYVWPFPSGNETDDDLRCLNLTKFGYANKKLSLGRLPTLKENVAFFA